MSDIIDYEKLRNGSDIRGIAMENSEGAEINLTPDAVRHLAAAFVKWLEKDNAKKPLRIAVGRDSRITGPELAQAVFDGISAAGAKPYDLGLASTPAMFMSTVLGETPYDGSIMITASHLPSHRNGMKFFSPKGGLEKEDIGFITKNAPDTVIEEKDIAAEKAAFMDTYTAYLREKIINGVNAADRDHPLKGLHIIVDAGNGAGGFFAEKVLKELGADVSGSLFLDPDGRFPNHIPNPENKEAAGFIREATLKNKADLGIIFDTDVDRAGAVLPDGRELTRNDLIAVLSTIVIREHPGTTIVTDSVTSDGLADFIKAKGGIHKRFKRGYRNVINEAIRLNKEGVDSDLAIETSGHGALKENYFLDDGAYLMVKLLTELGKGSSLKDMIADLREPAESGEVRFPVTAEDVSANGDMVLKLLTESAGSKEGWSLEKENYEGVRVNTDEAHGNGWFLLRKSLHEPIMPLNMESNTKGGSGLMAEELLKVLSEASGIDLKPLKDFAQNQVQ
ncbi:MAG: phosphomannomutase/phosphoglucomutase [Lachnospiraceae bacterium]|nr:phosphomannomutase/phosphoglucomutase [Lachnospiraceae bacterium]